MKKIPHIKPKKWSWEMSLYLRSAIILAFWAFLIYALFSLYPVSKVRASPVCSNSGACASVSPVYVGRFRCLVHGLERAGQPIRFMGGYRNTRIAGTWQMSKHSIGAALDINQYSRNYSRPGMIRGASFIANRCGLFHGALWQYADAGHFEVGGRRSHGRRHFRHRHNRRHHR